MGKKSIVILVDNGLRDLLNCRILQEEFLRRGFKVYFCNKRNFKPVLRRVEPQAFIASRGDFPYLPEIARCCNLYVVPCEGGRLTPQTMMSVFLGRVHNRDVLARDVKRLDHYAREIADFSFIRKVYLWGPQSHKFLSDSGYFRQDQLMVAGVPKLDIYRVASKKETGPKDELVVGLAFSVKNTSIYHGKYEYAKSLYNFDERDHLPMVPQGRHWEDYTWRDFAILRHMMRVVKKYLENHKGKLIVRVGPFENPADYEFLHKLYPDRVKIQEPKGELYEFLKQIDVLLTCWSTVGLEALLLNIPVIAIPFLIDYQHLTSHIDPQANGFDTFLPCYHLPHSEDETLELIEKRRAGRLVLTPDPGTLQRVVKNTYNWPADEPAARIIVDDILKDMKDAAKNGHMIWSANLPTYGVIEGTLRVMPLFRPFLFWLLGEISFLKYLCRDLASGSFNGLRRHYMMYSYYTDRVLKELKLEHSLRR